MPESETIEAWGRVKSSRHTVTGPWFLDQAAACCARRAEPVLARGLGRSYGDVAMNCGGRSINTTRLDSFLYADWREGVIRVEAGLSIDDLLRVCVPKGWFPPVTPGTKFVTLGGAVANDVHGKNHETAGAIGRHVLRIGLARSCGRSLELTPSQNPELFSATIGGLGLTGIMLWIELRLMPIRSSYFETETLAFDSLDSFFELAQEGGDWPYSAAWIDAAARGKSIGRGLLFRGRHAAEGGLHTHPAPRWRVPNDAPLFNALTLRLFNAYFRKRSRPSGVRLQHYAPFLYPLDRLANWNRLYGARGFFQHQSVAPLLNARDTIRELLRLTAKSGETPALIVLKLFGDLPSPGLLSFPMRGATLAIDLPNRGERTLRLLDALTNVVGGANGRIYPAKDATMSPSAFRAAFPHWRRLEALRDPAIMSDFWKRVTREA